MGSDFWFVFISSKQDVFSKKEKGKASKGMGWDGSKVIYKLHLVLLLLHYNFVSQSPV
jgi:hypothetical protein